MLALVLLTRVSEDSFCSGLFTAQHHCEENSKETAAAVVTTFASICRCCLGARLAVPPDIAAQYCLTCKSVISLLLTLGQELASMGTILSMLQARLELTEPHLCVCMLN